MQDYLEIAFSELFLQHYYGVPAQLVPAGYVGVKILVPLRYAVPKHTAENARYRAAHEVGAKRAVIFDCGSFVVDILRENMGTPIVQVEERK